MKVEFHGTEPATTFTVWQWLMHPIRCIETRAVDAYRIEQSLVKPLAPRLGVGDKHFHPAEVLTPAQAIAFRMRNAIMNNDPKVLKRLMGRSGMRGK